MSNLSSVTKELKTKGFALVKGYLSDNIEFKKFKNEYYNLVCIRAKEHNICISDESSESINQAVMQLDAINKKTSAFFNDALNASPALFQLLSSENIKKLAPIAFGKKDDTILINNYRARIQIPGHDEVSNLSWHQDSHYNNFYLFENSIVVWISVSDIGWEEGPIVFKKGSHVLKQVPREEYKKPNGHIVYTVADRYSKHSDFPEQSIQTKSGDVVLIDMNVLHKSGDNLSGNVKLSLQCRCHNASTPGFLPHYL